MSTNQPDPGADGTPSEELEIMTDADIDEATSGLSAIQTLLALPQADDAGAQTADRYDWQAAMAAADGLALHLLWQNNHFAGQDPDELKIICELHEDWIVQMGTEAELVSAKHRDPSSGPWKDVSSLVSDGGIGHLFARWLAADQKPSARLVTNAATAVGQARHLAQYRQLLAQAGKTGTTPDDTVRQLDACVDAFCKGIMMYRKNIPPVRWQAAPATRSKNLTVPNDLVDASLEFLRVLSIQEGRPDRSVVAHAAPPTCMPNQ